MNQQLNQFTQHFQVLNEKELKQIVGGYGEVTLLSFNKGKRKIG
ncbi:MAG: bacteriocin [Streptococcus infantarius]|jgi:bacteriocin-like protein|nr:bacteriocin [Streptococcus sp. KCJ4932]MDY2775371.1 bacteriocin [Streptococcus infantarius]TDE67028.1 bacteriocin [Streptococcus sp. KCJ4932]